MRVAGVGNEADSSMTTKAGAIHFCSDVQNKYAMTWVARDSHRYWIGLHRSKGLVVVPEWEIKASKSKEGMVFVFFVEDNRMAHSKAIVLRDAFIQRAIVKQSDAEEAVTLYLEKLTENGHCPPPDPYRSNYCWKCKEKVSGDLNLLCNKCNYLVCRICGACNCNTIV